MSASAGNGGQAPQNHWGGITVEFLKTDSLDAAVTTLFGNGVYVAGRHPVYGGDINQSYRLSLSDGSDLFMKCNTMGNLPFFTAEAQGLAALRGAGAIGVPKALATGTDQAQGVSFLLMEYLDPASLVMTTPALGVISSARTATTSPR